MPIAAVPSYLGQNFDEASPGMRFGHLLPIWTCRADQENDVKNRAKAKSYEGNEVSTMLKDKGMDATILHLRQREKKPLPGLWVKNDFAARDAWKNICRLTESDRQRMEALRYRQQIAITSKLPQERLTLEAQSTAPFTTGLGNEHPLENGFAFLNPYGLPYLPGSGVKGVLRQAARELASGEWGDTGGWQEEKNLSFTANGTAYVISMLDALFGYESQDGEQHHLRGALTFWDVIPQIRAGGLSVEIMTPHQSHYYQQKGERKPVSPHDSGQPNPISFLTIPPGSGFSFLVACDTTHLQSHAPDLVAGEHWKTLLQAAFSHAFSWLGFGAKTAVGYGAMTDDPKAAQHHQERQNQLEAATKRINMSEAMKRIDDFIATMQKRHTELRGKATQPNGKEHQQVREFAKFALEAADWIPEEKRAAAEAVSEWLPKVINLNDKQLKEERKKLKLNELLGKS